MGRFNRWSRRGAWVSLTLVLIVVSYWLIKQRSSSSSTVIDGAQSDSSEFDYVKWTMQQVGAPPSFDQMSPEEFSHWQAEERRRFERQFLFPYPAGVEVSAVGETISRRGYTKQEFWVTLNHKRLFRFYKLRSEQLVRPTPAVVVFMGHGKIEEVLDLPESYQRGAASEFASAGYLVFAMENVGMGPHDTKRTHIELDSILSLSGYSWYSLLFAHQRLLLDHVLSDPEVDTNAVGVAGVSTGGILALAAAALEPRVRAASVHGIFGSLANSFARDGKLHCSCGTIDGALPSFDLPRLALLVVPRTLHINNNRSDTFPPADALQSLAPLNGIFVQFGGSAPTFTSPSGKHSFALPEALTVLDANLH